MIGKIICLAILATNVCIIMLGTSIYVEAQGTSVYLAELLGIRNTGNNWQYWAQLSTWTILGKS